MASGPNLPRAPRPRSPGFVDPTTMQIGSSSPANSGSFSSHPGSAHVPTLQNAPAEQATLHFFRLALSHVLNYGPPQHEAPLPPQRSLVVVSSHQRIYEGKVNNLGWVAINDGGLDIFSPRAGLGGRRVCQLEAKSNLSFSTGFDGTPVPSDFALAQMTGQALAVYMARPIENSRGYVRYSSSRERVAHIKTFTESL